MKTKFLFLFVGFLIMSSTGFSQDIAIDGNGNLTTGTSNSHGNLKVIGASGEHGVVGETGGTGAAGIYGKSTDSNNYGILGSDNYGVYGNSSSGYAGYFEGNTRVIGNLTIDGSLIGETDPTVNASLKDGVDWTELTGIPAGFADGTDDAGGSGIWTQNGSAIYYNLGNVGIGTTNPAGKLDVSGDICLGGICRSTWPSGSGTGAFTDTGTSAYYNGGNVGIGTSSPQTLLNVDSRVLHIVQPLTLQTDTAAGIRTGVGLVDGGITSAYNSTSGEGGMFVGTLSNHRLGFGTNSLERMSITPGGYVGIGTKMPLQRLHIQGSAYVSDILGIGVDAPTNNLQVSGTSSLFSSGSGDFRMFISKNLDTDKASLIFQKGPTGHAELGLTGDNDFHIKVSADGATFSDVLFVNHIDGNIGMGTNSAEGKLVVAATNFPSFISENAGTEPSIMAFKSGSGDAVYIQKRGVPGSALVIEQRGSDPALLIKTVVNNVENNLMVVESTGAVGIGTITPQSTLQVNGYTQLALTSGTPPSADCDDVSERGRMKIDNAAGLLYICVNSGWVSK